MAGTAALVFDGSRPGHAQWAASFLDIYQQSGGLGYAVQPVDVARLGDAAVRKALVAVIDGRTGGDVFLCLPPDRSLLYGAAMRAVVETMVAAVQHRAAAQAEAAQPTQPAQPLLRPTVVAARTTPGAPVADAAAPQGQGGAAAPPMDPRLQAAFAERPSQNDPADYASTPHVAL